LSDDPQKLLLGENHRRVVSAVLRQVESTCGEILEWIERPGRDLLRFNEDLAPSQIYELRGVVRELREESRRVEEEMVVDALVQPRARAISATISLTQVEIQEVLTPGLRGYGTLPPEVEGALDAKFMRLLDCLQRMSKIAGRKVSGRCKIRLPRFPCARCP
jgi:hypothetical protein